MKNCLYRLPESSRCHHAANPERECICPNLNDPSLVAAICPWFRPKDRPRAEHRKPSVRESGMDSRKRFR